MLGRSNAIPNLLKLGDPNRNHDPTRIIKPINPLGRLQQFPKHGMVEVNDGDKMGLRLILGSADVDGEIAFGRWRRRGATAFQAAVAEAARKGSGGEGEEVGEGIGGWGKVEVEIGCGFEDVEELDFQFETSGSSHDWGNGFFL